MKKTTIYTLLCTTILTSGISLAADDNLDSTKTPKPNRVAQLKEKQPVPMSPISTLVSEASQIHTPTKDELEKKYDISKYSPGDASNRAERDRIVIHAQNQSKRQELEYKAATLKLDRQLAADKVEEEEAREKLLEERRAELERESVERNKSVNAQIEESRRAQEELEKRLSELLVQIDSLGVEKKKLEEEAALEKKKLEEEALEKKRLEEQVSATEQTVSKLEQEKVQLEKTNVQLVEKVQRERKDATADLKELEKQRLELEKEAAKLRRELLERKQNEAKLKGQLQTKIELEKLTPSTQAASSQQGISSSSGLGTGSSPLGSGEPTVINNSPSSLPSSVIPSSTLLVSDGNASGASLEPQLLPQLPPQLPPQQNAGTVVTGAGVTTSEASSSAVPKGPTQEKKARKKVEVTTDSNF